MIEAIAALSASAGHMSVEPVAARKGLEEMAALLIAAHGLVAQLSAARLAARTGAPARTKRPANGFTPASPPSPTPMTWTRRAARSPPPRLGSPRPPATTDARRRAKTNLAVMSKAARRSRHHAVARKAEGLGAHSSTRKPLARRYPAKPRPAKPSAREASSPRSRARGRGGGGCAYEAVFNSSDLCTHRRFAHGH